MKILSMSGFVPEHITDIVRFTSFSGVSAVSHYCGYISDYISQVIQDTSIDGAVFPKSCDSSRVLEAYLSDSGKFLYSLDVPARQDEMAISYFACVIKNYKNAFSEFFNTKIMNIEDRTEKINARNKKLKKIYDNIGDICYSEYIKYVHQLLQLPLEEQEITFSFSNKETGNKNVYLVGSFLSNCSIAEAVEKYGMRIVGDNLTESGRLVSTPQVSLQGNLYENIARSILTNRLSPTQNRFEAILDYDLEEINRKSVDGVIFVNQKYCEPYEYLYSVYKKRLDSMGIPILKITLADSEDVNKSLLAIETFAEIL